LFICQPVQVDVKASLAPYNTIYMVVVKLVFDPLLRIRGSNFYLFDTLKILIIDPDPVMLTRETFFLLIL